jgi:hypothetical protein
MEGKKNNPSFKFPGATGARCELGSLRDILGSNLDIFQNHIWPSSRFVCLCRVLVFTEAKPHSLPKPRIPFLFASGVRVWNF